MSCNKKEVQNTQSNCPMVHWGAGVLIPEKTNILHCHFWFWQATGPDRQCTVCLLPLIRPVGHSQWSPHRQLSPHFVGGQCNLHPDLQYLHCVCYQDTRCKESRLRELCVGKSITKQVLKCSVIHSLNIVLLLDLIIFPDLHALLVTILERRSSSMLFKVWEIFLLFLSRP